MGRLPGIRLLFKLIIFSGIIWCFYIFYKESKIYRDTHGIQGLNDSVYVSNYSYGKEKLSLDSTDKSRKFAEVSQSPEPNNQYENKEPRFQLVDDIQETFVYSAFYDGRRNRLIRVIVVVKDKLGLERYSCITHPDNVHLPATLEYISEPSWGYKYRGGFIACDLTNTEKPKAVSIILNSQIKNNTNFSPKNILIVQYSSNFMRNFTRCVPAVHDFTNQNTLIQMLESDLMFGMDHFIMYNYSGINPQIQQTLKSYQDEGVLTLLQWDLPVSKLDIHYFGQMSNMHECMLRNMYVSKYVFIADVDEIVVSETYSSWQSLTSSVLRKQPNCGAIAFRNAFFPTYFNDDTGNFPGKENAQKMGLTFLLKTTRTKLHNIGDRSKILVRPETIQQMWIHSVHKFFDTKMKTCPMTNPRDALLHHYRVKAFDMRLPYSNDKTFQKYSEKLIARVNKRLQRIKSTLPR